MAAVQSEPAGTGMPLPERWVSLVRSLRDGGVGVWKVGAWRSGSVVVSLSCECIFVYP